MRGVSGQSEESLANQRSLRPIRRLQPIRGVSGQSVSLRLDSEDLQQSVKFGHCLLDGLLQACVHLPAPAQQLLVLIIIAIDTYRTNYHSLFKYA